MPYPRLKTENYAQIDGLDRRLTFFAGNVPRAVELVNLTYQTPGEFTPRPGSVVDTLPGATLPVSLVLSESFFLKEAKYGLGASIANRTYLFATEMGLFMKASGGTQVIVQNGPLAPGTEGVPAPWSTAEFIRTFAANGSFFICVNVEDNPNTPRFYNALDGGLGPLLPGATGLYATYSGGASAWLGATGFVRYAIGSGFFNVSDGLFAPFISTHGFNGITATTGPITVSGVTAPVDVLFLYRQQGTDPNFYLLGPLTKTGASFAPYVDFGVRTDTIAPAATFAFFPRILCQFNNALFAANLIPISQGIYAPESTVAFSALGRPVFFGATQTFQVGNDTSEPITGMYAWQTQLLIAKQRSLYVLTGSDARSYNLRQVSSTVGAVGPNAFCEIEGGKRLAIIGDDGISVWNGSSLDHNFAEPVYDAFSPSPGIYSSAAVWPERNEAWFLLNGSTLGTSEARPPRGRLLVYDFFVKQWWEAPNYPGNVLAYIPQLNVPASNPPAIYFGGSSNYIFRHDELRVRDLALLPGTLSFGQAITCAVATAFRQELGNSTEKMYRRLQTHMSLNRGSTLTISEIGGTSFAVTVQFRVNGLTNTVLSRTFNPGFTGPNNFWLNFGISAKQLAMRWVFQNVGNETFKIAFRGYALESRYQRST